VPGGFAGLAEISSQTLPRRAGVIFFAERLPEGV